MALQSASREPHAGSADAARDAPALAKHLRTARLTIAWQPVATPGAPPARWPLNTVLMPLLRRRLLDRPAAARDAGSTVIPFPERRRAGRSLVAGPAAEVAVFFDAWRATALADLKQAIDRAADFSTTDGPHSTATLAEFLERRQQQLGVRFLIVLGRFEHVLEQAAAEPANPQMREAASQIFEAADRLLLAANFLIAPSAESKRWFDRLRDPIAGFDDRVLQWPLKAADEAPAAAAAPHPMPAAAPPSRVLTPDFTSRAAPAARAAKWVPEVPASEPAPAAPSIAMAPPPPTPTPTPPAPSEPSAPAPSEPSAPAPVVAPAPAARAASAPRVAAAVDVPAAETTLQKAVPAPRSTASPEPLPAPPVRPIVPELPVLRSVVDLPPVPPEPTSAAPSPLPVVPPAERESETSAAAPDAVAVPPPTVAVSPSMAVTIAPAIPLVPRPAAAVPAAGLPDPSVPPRPKPSPPGAPGATPAPWPRLPRAPALARVRATAPTVPPASEPPAVAARAPTQAPAPEPASEPAPAQVAASAQAPATALASTQAPAPAMNGESAPFALQAPAPETALNFALASARQPPRVPAVHRWGLIGGCCVAAAGVAWLWWSGREPDRPADVIAAAPVPARPAMTPPRTERPQPPARPAPLPPAALPAPMPMPAAEIDPDSSMARELAHALDVAGVGVDVRAARGADDLLAPGSPGAPPRLLIARYDALRTARAPAGGAAAPLQVIAPLYTEEAQFFVRADSALRFIHEIEGRSIDLGPADGSRAATIGALYQRLFGAAPKASPASALPQAAGFGRLLDDAVSPNDRVEVVALVGGQPLESLASLPPQVQSRLRLLRLDPSHPASQRALRSFLPATVGAGVGSTGASTPTLAEMAFLVAPMPVDDALAGHWAEALCRGLTSLRREGHAKWAEVQPGLVLDTGWPQSAPAQRALEACAPARKPPG